MSQVLGTAQQGRPRVLSIPSAHPYVAQALPMSSIDLLPDATDPWWPPIAFDPQWMAEHGRSADLVHVHFGFEHVAPGVLAEWCDVLAALRLPLVLTVHDLRNPHLVDNGMHLARLGLLVARADALITLTAGAAQEVHRRFGRHATVVPHPNLVPDEIAGSLRAATHERRGLVGIEFGVGRANVIDPELILPPVAQAVAAAGGTLLVGVRREARPLVDRIRSVAKSIEPAAPLRVLVDGLLNDDDLYRRVARRQVMVLPYRFGTHSGWLELCRDLGTRVVAPTCGHYADQWAEVHSFRCDERSGLDGDELRRVIGTALAAPMLRMTPGWRRRQRDHGRMVHERLYRRAAAAMTATSAAARVAS